MRYFYLGRTFVLLTFFLITHSHTFAQKEVAKWIEEVRKNNQFSEEFFFQPNTNLVNKSETANGTSITVDLSKLADLCNKPRPTLTLTLPIEGRSPVTVELARIQVTTSNFKVSSSSLIKQNPKTDAGVHYRGIVKGDAESVVAISIYHGEIRGFIADKTGKYEIGKVENTVSEHIIFNENDLTTKLPFSCGSNANTKPKNATINAANLRETAATTGVGCKTVTVYLECDYQMYLDNGSSVANVTNYVTSFFNQVATLYQNENIDIQISEIYVWTSPDPYRTLTSTLSVLQAFDVNRGANFNGNLAHFLTTRSLGGGIAYVNTLCTKAYAHGVSMVQNTFATYPTFSWTVECVAHELGHNLGSNHTQWCGWQRPDGTTGPIDNCATPEGGCTTVGATPTNGGTIMSYCHLTSTGINFANGFGALPGNTIRTNVTNATCLVSSNVTAAPTGQQTTNIASNTATLSWNAVPNGVTYSVDYKLKTATSWTTLGNYSNTTTSLTGLSAGTNYDWRVKCDCSGYSTATSFTTTGTASCSAPISLTSSSMTSNSAILKWGLVTGATNYTLQYKTATATTWTTAATVTNNTYTISGLSASTAYTWQVKANCSANSTTASFTTLSASCVAPTNLLVNNLASNSANLSWGAVSGATNYTIQYRTSISTTWISAGTVTATNYILTGLVANTAYTWQVKANCSAYSSTASFTSLSASCTAPSGLTTTKIVSTSATLAWNTVSGATSYTIQYKASTATSWLTAATVSSTNYNLTALSAGITYNWQVKANCSVYSIMASFITPAASSCLAPSGVSTTNIASSAATLVWNAVSGATTYTIQYKTSTATTWSTAATVATTNYNLTALVSGTTYSWQVKANCSAYSTVTNFTTITCTAPTGLASMNIVGSSATIVWNLVSGATNYTIQYKKSNASAWTTRATVTANAFSLTGLSKNTTYNWRIKANCSAYSAIATFKTNATLRLNSFVVANDFEILKENQSINLPTELKTKFSIFPNPAQNNVSLKINNEENITGDVFYQVVDFRGKVRKSQKITDDNINLEISDLESGLYIIQMVSKLGVVESKTLIKE